MKKQEAINLIEDTFRKSFDEERFTRFVKEVFNEIDIAPRNWAVWKEYEDYISEYKQLGSYQDGSKKVIDVLVVKLKKTSSRDRARTMQRNFVAKYLSNRDKDAALVAFYGEELEDWRFSFVKMEYELVRDEDGKVKPERSLTPAKRYSYLVGKNEPNHTCRSQFLDLVKEDKQNPFLSDIEAAFSIDNVTKEFFIEYKELFHKLEESLKSLIEKDSFVRREFETKNIDTVDFSKKLLGQIVFLHFLQKKGWLGVQKDADGKFKEWGTGPKDFMKKLFDKEIVDYDNFYLDVLEPLFYEALAREHDNDYYSKLKCRIPFLNGGLFEPINDFNWVETKIALDNEIFAEIFRVFNQYNFTVKEDEPLEKEVAIDPEMLGKVFENLLEVKDRKSRGAFYTPREIVHYMCQQSLINYLETNTGIERGDIEKFVQYGDFTTADDAKIIDEIKSKKEKLIKGIINDDDYRKEALPLFKKLKLPATIIDSRIGIDELLKNIKVVDPAVGSGAFPIGMLNEIVKARTILSLFQEEERKIYDLKRETIENCLYGVDIDNSAVEIAKLRFWLSLVVDEQDMDNIQPLPNLDHKIVCGNSLLEEFEGVKLFDETLLGKPRKDYSEDLKRIDDEIFNLRVEKGKLYHGDGRARADIDAKIKALKRREKDLRIKAGSAGGQQSKIFMNEAELKISKLRELQRKFFNEENPKKKQKQRRDIENIEWELIEATLKEQGNEEAMQKLEQYRKTKAKPFFLWKLYFAEVFQRENPGFDVVIANPPYVDSENMVKEMPELRAIYTDKFQSAKGNWDLFIVFIDQGLTLLKKQGVISYIVPNKLIGAKYSETLKKMLIVKRIIEIRDYSSVDVFKEADVYPVTFVISDNLPNNDVIMSLMDDLDIIGNTNIIPPEIFYADIDWARYFVRNKRALNVVIKICKNVPLAESFHDVSGAATVNEAYELKNLIFNDKNPTDDFKKFINTGTIDPYICLWGHKITRYIKQGYQYPVVRNSDLENFKMTRYRQACSEKIIIGGMTKNLECFYDSGVYLAGKSTTIILPGNVNLKVLVTLLNSKLISFWYKIFFKSLSLSGGYLRISNHEIKRIPLAKINDDNQKKIIVLVDQILTITESDDYLDNPEKQARVKELEAKIDKLVYELYGLTPEEIEIVEGFGEGGK